MKAMLRALAGNVTASVAKCAVMNQEIRQDAKLAETLLLGVQSNATALCTLCCSLPVSATFTFKGDLQAVLIAITTGPEHIGV